MVAATEISRSFRRKVSAGVSIESNGLDRFIVYTPFSFDDGDHYVVILKRDGDNWVLTDEGHTFMHLSYRDVDLSTGTRSQVIDKALAGSQMENRSGELRLVVPGKEYGDALFTFVQTLARISSTADWTQERVRSTFHEDVAALVEGAIPLGRVTRAYIDKNVDANATSPIDFLIRGEKRKWLVFAVANDTHCQQATIACLKYQTPGTTAYSSLVIYENMQNINRRFVAQLADPSDKAFSSIADRNRITKYLETEVMGNGSHS